MSKLQPMGTVSNPVNAATIPVTLKDTRPFLDRVRSTASDTMDKLSESEIVDQATNAAAIIVREKGERNKKSLADKIGNWIDDLSKNHGGFVGRIIRMLPLKTILSKGISKLIDTIADWLEGFSDASEDDNGSVS